MELSTLTRSPHERRSRRVGRGGKRGKTSGRGGKGQTARAGNKRRPEWRDIIKKIPKRRGYGRNRGRTYVPYVASVGVNLDMLSKHFKDGDMVSPGTLFKMDIIRKVSGKVPPVKILAEGELSKKLTFKGVEFSKTSRDKIGKAGGVIPA